MPASRPASSEALGTRAAAASPSGRARAPRHAFHDDAAVSEVVGQILAFGIVAAVFVFSMVAFQMSQERATDRVVALRAESAATRVAGLAVQAGILVENHGTAVEARFLADLPQDLEGRSYLVKLLPPGGGETGRVVVEVPSRGITATAPLFAVEAAAGVAICSSTVDGAPVLVRFSDDVNPGTPCIFLEAAP